MVAHVAGGWATARRLALPIVLLAATMGTTQYLLATHGLWNIAGFGGGIAGLAVCLLLTRRFRGPSPGGPPAPDGWSAFLSLAGYVALVVVTLLVQLIPSLKELLGHVVLQLPFPEVHSARGFMTPADPGPRIVLLRHASALLTYASAAAYLIYHLRGQYRRGALRRVLVGTMQGVLPSTLSIAAMVSLAVVMAYSGMTDALARGLAQAAGRLFPMTSPWIGALGAFISGSNANSNLLFSILQLRTAELLGISVPLILAAQTAGGAIGSMVAPTKAVVAVGTIGQSISEGEILRHLIRYAAVLLAGLSLVVFLWLQVAPP
jgi:lactate permease